MREALLLTIGSWRGDDVRTKFDGKLVVWLVSWLMIWLIGPLAG